MPKGNFGLGTATPEVSELAGQAWVGEGATTSKNGIARVSKDGLRQYRAPTDKAKLGTTQSILSGETSLYREIPQVNGKAMDI